MQITKLGGHEISSGGFKIGVTKKSLAPELRATLKSQPGEKQLKHIDDGWVDTDQYNMSDEEFLSRQAKAEIRREKWNNFKKAFKELFD